MTSAQQCQEAATIMGKSFESGSQTFATGCTMDGLYSNRYYFTPRDTYDIQRSVVIHALAYAPFVHAPRAVRGGMA